MHILHFLFPVGDEVVSSVGRGLCVLLGISRHDTSKDMDYMYVYLYFDYIL